MALKRATRFWNNLTKNQRIAVIALFFTACAPVATIFAAFIRSWPLPPAPEPATPRDTFVNVGTGAIQLGRGQMLVIADSRAAAVAKFTFGHNGASYEWRYLDHDSGLETTGADILYELYDRTPMAQGYHVVDVGSHLEILIGHFHLEWSCASDTSGWVYYEHVGLAVLDGTGFQTLDLSRVRFAGTEHPPTPAPSLVPSQTQ